MLELGITEDEPDRPAKRIISGPHRRHLSAGGVTLDRYTRFATFGGGEIELPKMEFFLLEFLMRRSPEFTSRTVIEKEVWRRELTSGTNVVEVYVNYLRQRFGKDYIATRRHDGYAILNPS
jgi:DNA-binding response OmpR family regulator